MSGKITGIVWESDLPQNEKYVLLAYADHADHEGNGIFPSVGLIAWKTGYSDRNIKRVKKSLIKKGYLVETGARASGTPVYRMDIEALPKLSPRGDNLSPVTPVSPGGDSIVSPEPSVNRHDSLYKDKPPKTKTKKPTPADIEYYNPLAQELLSVCSLAIPLVNGTKLDFMGVINFLQANHANPDMVREFGRWYEKTPNLKAITENWKLFIDGKQPRHKQFKNGNGARKNDKQQRAAPKSKYSNVL